MDTLLPQSSTPPHLPPLAYAFFKYTPNVGPGLASAFLHLCTSLLVAE